MDNEISISKTYKNFEDCKFCGVDVMMIDDIFYKIN